jgi:putative methionine-R-sulfoxide reductase with GAF domain
MDGLTFDWYVARMNCCQQSVCGSAVANENEVDVSHTHKHTHTHTHTKAEQSH